MSKALALSVIESSDQFSCLTKSQIFRYVNYYKIFFLQHIKMSNLKGIEKLKELQKEIEKQEITKEIIIIKLEILEKKKKE